MKTICYTVKLPCIGSLAFGLMVAITANGQSDTLQKFQNQVDEFNKNQVVIRAENAALGEQLRKDLTTGIDKIIKDQEIYRQKKLQEDEQWAEKKAIRQRQRDEREWAEEKAIRQQQRDNQEWAERLAAERRASDLQLEEEAKRLAAEREARDLAPFQGAATLEEARLNMKKYLQENPAAFGEERKEVEMAVETSSSWSNAIFRAEAKAKSLTCQNNLKCVGNAFRLWAYNHANKFPFHTSKKNGGTMDLRQIGSDSFDVNPFHHFRILTEDHGSPKELVCPSDSTRKPARNLTSLQGDNVTYQLCTGDKVTIGSSDEVLVRCPIHGHILYCDGSMLTAEKLAERQK